MHYLIYLSSAHPSFDQAQIEQMLSRARVKNRELGITGLLIHRDGNFIQYIEGEPAAVRGLYAAIAGDPRHHGVALLAEGEVGQRQFADWDMNLRQPFGRPLFEPHELHSDPDGIRSLLGSMLAQLR